MRSAALQVARFAARWAALSGGCGLGGSVLGSSADGALGGSAVGALAAAWATASAAAAAAGSGQVVLLAGVRAADGSSDECRLIKLRLARRL